MRVRPTEFGAKAAVLFGGLWVAFLASSYHNLFFLLLMFGVALGVLGVAWAVGNLSGLAVAAGAAAQMPAGRPGALPLRLVAPRRDRYGIAVALPLPGGAAEVGWLAELAGTAELSLPLPALPRGVHRLDHVLVRSQFPFGFVQVQRRLPVAVELVVHPPLHGAAASRGRGGGDDGAVPTAGAGPAVAGVRAFRSGDAVRDVHWKATARRREPVVKEREAELGGGAEVVFDRRVAPAAFEAALADAAAQLGAVLASGRRARFRSQGAEFAVGGGRGGDAALLRWLAEATPLPATAPPPGRAAAALAGGGR